jgi:translation initiation factor 5B
MEKHAGERVLEYFLPDIPVSTFRRCTTMKFTRSPIICLLAHVDHGKCVAPDTRITLSDGSVRTAREIYETHSSKGTSTALDDGVCVELGERPSFFSFDGEKITPMAVSHSWKRQASKLIKVTFANGDEISTTPEHPFLVFNDFTVGFKRADQLELTDAVLGPSKFPVKDAACWKSLVLEQMARADCFVVFLDADASARFADAVEKSNKQELKRKNLLTTPYNRRRFRATDFVNLARHFGFSLDEAYSWVVAFKNASKKCRAGKTSLPMRLPTENNLHELGYILGAFAGDGSVHGITLHSNDAEVQTAYIEYLRLVFGAEGRIKFGHTAWMVQTNGSKTLSRFFTEVLGVCTADKSATVSVPRICQNSFDAFRGFIEGWFDTDGYVSKINNCIEFTSKSEKIVKESAILLAGLGVHSTVYRKSIYWTLRIANRPFVQQFLAIFHPRLSRRVDGVRKAVHKSGSSRIYEKYAVSQQFRSGLKKAMPGEVNKKIGYFNRSINYQTLSGQFLRQVVQQVTKPTESSVVAEAFFQKQLIGVAIRSVEEVENPHGWVYDFTVPGLHNFVAERVIVHNTSLLDSIRGTAVAKKEAGGITQMIGASYVSRENMDAIAKDLAAKMKLTMKIPGLLFIDTPGHEAFGNLRDRGGSIADLVILLVDINQGFQPQTVESIKILKQYKTPFVIAANKIDAVSGWKSHKTTSFMETYNQQPEYVRNAFDDKIYGLIGKISEYGFDSERYDRVTDFTKQIAIIPVSAKTKEGLSELLVLIAGLSQRFLGESLEIDENGRGKGSVMEVKEERGLGTTVDVILYDGILRKNDDIAYMTMNGVKKTKVRGLLLPNLGGGEKYLNVDSVVAAAGVKIHAPGLEEAIPGSPLEVVEDFERDSAAIEAQFRNIIFEKKGELGIVLKADSLGSVEALLKLLANENIPVRGASVGHITRKDVIAAGAVANGDRFLGVVLGFNVSTLDEATEESRDSNVPIITSDIVYRLIDNYKDWVKETKEKMKKESLAKLTWPGKLKVLNGYVFRVSKPAVFGVEVLAGRVKSGYRLMNKAGEVAGEIREIQKEKEKVVEAEAGDQLAISCDGITIGKNVNEGDLLYTYMIIDELKKWDGQLHMLSDAERELYAEIRRALVKGF